MKTRLFITILFFSLFVACNNSQTDKSATNDKDSLYLNFPDSLFAFNDLKNSAVVRQFDWEGFTDSTKTKKLVRIDSLTVVKLLYPVNAIQTGSYSYFMTSFFYISKQHKIGDIQPIIIWGNGDDYSELILLTLDQKGAPIDFYSLHKNDCSGTWTEEDSLMAICPIKQSTINSNIIKTYINNVCYPLDTIAQSTTSDFARIDSIAFESTILPTGKINSRQVDSVRFHRLYKL